MNYSWLIPVLICASIGLSVAFTTWVRAKHGYPIEDDNGNLIHPSGIASDRQVELLSSENEKLNGRIARLEERIAVLERIATDPATRTAQEIDNLR